MNSFDALLVVSFGGPEKREDVMPFLENVLRGKNIPRERMLEVAEHYYHFDGRSPINDQNKQLIAALEQEFKNHGVKLPIYWGNRNWHPLLPDTLKQMQSMAFVTPPRSPHLLLVRTQAAASIAKTSRVRSRRRERKTW